MKKVVLRGELGKQFGRVHHFDLNTPAEAIRALCANFEGFQQALVTAAERGVGYIVQVGKLAIEELDEIHNPTGQSEEISITPVLAGAGGGVGKILAGVALVAAACNFCGPHCRRLPWFGRRHLAVQPERPWAVLVLQLVAQSALSASA
jgi:predicted phage tail protein